MKFCIIIVFVVEIVQVCFAHNDNDEIIQNNKEVATINQSRDSSSTRVQVGRIASAEHDNTRTIVGSRQERRVNFVSCSPTKSPHLRFYFPTKAPSVEPITPIPTKSTSFSPTKMIQSTPVPTRLTQAPIYEITTPSPTKNTAAPSSANPVLVPTTSIPTDLSASPLTPTPIQAPTTLPATLNPTLAPTLSPTSDPTSSTTLTPTVNPTPVSTPAPTETQATKVFEVISAIALEGGNEFQNPDNYQRKAFDFVDNESTDFSEERVIQRYALACLYYATYRVSNTYTETEMVGGGTPPGWKQSNNWVVPDADECIWFGITCDDEDNGMVTKIVLPDNRLTGSFPPEVALLSTSLQDIDLYQNEFLTGGVGPNGNAFIGSLTELRAMYFAFCKFESTTGVPTEVGLLTKLEEYDSAYNVFSGPLDGSTFAPLRNLVYLDISGGLYESSIPDQLASLPNLEDFFVTDAFLTGDISYLTKLSSLYQHTADQNPSLGGSIPEGTLLRNDIELLSFSNCNLSGTIPSSIGNLNNLQQLYLNNNKIYGTVPTELGLLSLLAVFEIQDNDITGSMPNEICNNRNTGGLSNGSIERLISDCPDEIFCPLDTCCTACGGVGIQ